MAQLVILGHKTRSKEVIEILEMLGGRNSRDYVCNVPGYAYSINEQGIIDLYISHSNSSITFTLEEFLEKFPYKVGDKVLLSGVVKIIKQVCWSDTENEVIYKLETNVRGFSEEYHVHHYDLQPYKEETMEKINVAKLLEDCPRGMELDCILFDAKVIYQGLSKRTPTHPIIVQTEHGFEFELTQYGQIHNIVGSNCVIYPKGKSTWEGFQRPFKPGDIVITDNNEHAFIYSGENNKFWECYCGVYCGTRNICINSKQWSDKQHKLRLATEKEKEKLFQVIKDNGYKWNPETKELEKLIQPQFKVGDWIIRNNKYTGIPVKVIEFNGYYSCELNGEVVNLTLNDVHNNFHLWTIQDAKDGDIISYDSGWTCIFKRIHGIWYSSYCFITDDGEFHTGYERHAVDSTINGNAHPATENQCRLLFRKIKEKGYKWNPYTKTLEEPIKPKFKVGDKVRGKYTNNIYTISDITPTEYKLTNGQSFTFNAEDCHELVTDKFNITTLKPFAEVLVRNTNNGRWHGQLYMSYNENEEYPFECTYNCWKQCIPYEGNEHLFNKTDSCTDYFKTWE